MAWRKDKKYKLIRGEKQTPRNDESDYYKERVYRLQALRDIPEHGVKAGDLGGLVTAKDNLSHEGSCWVGHDAEVFGRVYISADAYIGDNASIRGGQSSHAIMISSQARITGNAIVATARYTSGFRSKGHTYIMDDAHIYGDAILENVQTISKAAKIYGNARIHGTKEVTDNAEIFGNAYLDEDVIVLGNSKIHGKAQIEEKSTIRSADISGDVIVPKYDTIGERVLTEQKQLALSSHIYEVPETKVLTSKKSRLLSVYHDLKAKIASYETDIVKIIKYPTMTDRSDVATLAMSMALTAAERLVDEPDCDEEELAEAVKELEAKFMVAESNALKLAATKLSEAEQKKVEKARDLLAIAADEASSENEKKQSFKQAFKQLEGVVVVPEIALDTFRVKIGLKELEA